MLGKPEGESYNECLVKALQSLKIMCRTELEES